MSRVNVTGDGWFDPDAKTARAWPEGTRWDGNNMISLATGRQWDHEELWLTAGGRWAVRWWTQWQGGAPAHTRWVTPDEARDWLVRCDYDGDAIADALGEPLPDESGPDVGGRPAIGPRIAVAYPRDLLDRIEAAAEADGVTRAAWLRAAAESALS